MIDIPNLVERDGEKANVRLSFNMNDKQLDDYLDKMKQELDIEYLDLGEYKVEDEKVDITYDNKSEVARLKDRVVEFKLKSNQRIIRAVAMKVNQNFMAKPTVKYRLGVVTRKTRKK